VRGQIPPYLARYVDRIESYQREWLLDTYFLLTGERATSDRGIHERYRDLNDGRLFHVALEHGDRSYARAIANAYFAAAPALAEAGDRLRAARPKLVVQIDGASLGVQQLRVRVASEPDARKRIALERAALDLVELRANLERAWVEAHAEVSRSLGFARHSALIEALEGDVGPWLRHAERWLEHTRADFLARWRAWRERDRLETGPFTPYLGREPTLGSGATDMPTSVRATAAAWGFGDIAERIPIDVAPRPGKSPLSFCARIAPPRDVRITTQGSTNPLFYSVLLHEFGHALHFSLGPDRPFDVYGDHQAVTEAFGMTFGFVALQPDWYEKFVGVSIGAEDLERVRFLQDLFERIDATQLLYEHAVHSGNAEPVAEFQRLYRREFEADVTPHLAYSRMQLFLEARPFYPLYLHQANSMRSALWNDLCSVGGEHWYLGNACRSYLVERFRTTCEVDLAQWLKLLGSTLPSESSDGGRTGPAA
jgi:hypothetical protein